MEEWSRLGAVQIPSKARHRRGNQFACRGPEVQEAEAEAYSLKSLVFHFPFILYCPYT